MASTMIDASRGTVASPSEHQKSFVPKTSRELSSDQTDLQFDQFCSGRYSRIVFRMSSSETNLVREITYNVKDELQRTFYEKVNQKLG